MWGTANLPSILSYPLASELPEVANNLAIYELECTFQKKYGTIPFWNGKFIGSSDPQSFFHLFPKYLPLKKNIIVKVRENVEKLVIIHLEMYFTYE